MYAVSWHMAHGAIIVAILVSKTSDQCLRVKPRTRADTLSYTLICDVDEVRRALAQDTHYTGIPSRNRDWRPSSDAHTNRALFFRYLCTSCTDV